MRDVAPKITLAETDHKNLTLLIRRLGEHQSLDALADEVGRAEVLADDCVPDDVVTMNSIVDYEDLDSGKTMRMQLTYPAEADVDHGKISVLAPIGTALLGLKVGQPIKWTLPDGKTRRLRAKRLYRPEAKQRRRA